MESAALAKYADLAGAVPHLSFASPPERVTPKMKDTPEGYLICYDVALARTGDQIYASYEVPLEPGPDGTVVAQRDEQHVFDPQTIESFHGKPFTNDHPWDDVTAENYKRHLIGVVINPRRGPGDRSNCLLGDIVVYDPKAIRDIKSGKREVSCGYDADYEKIAPGRGRQINIRGNHVSLVAEGRCGPLCAINDRKLNMSDVAAPQVTKKNSFFDALKNAFKAKDLKDEDGVEKYLKEASDALADPTEKNKLDAKEETIKKDEGKTSKRKKKAAAHITT